MPPTTPFRMHRDTPWLPLLKRWAAALFLGCLASLFSLNAQASTAGTTVDFWGESSGTPYRWNADPSLAVGSGVEFDTGAFRFDVDPAAGTFTIDVYQADPAYRVWGGLNNDRQFSVVLSGGTLYQFTGITPAGGTAGDAGSYAAAFNGKTLTFTVPSNTQPVAQGTIVFTFTSMTTPTPTVTGATPNSGSTAGGTVVTLTGTHFTAGATAVTFGGSSATGITVLSATSLTATTPAHTAGPVNVRVTTPGGYATLTNGYTYAVPSSNASLSGLALSAGTLSPAFTTGNTSYTAAVNDMVASITVTPTLADANATVTVTKAASGLFANIFSTQVSCTGGSNGTATALAYGGVPPYTYLWSPGQALSATATGLPAGTYSVTVTDRAGSTFTVANIAISQPASALTGSASVVAHPVGSNATGRASVSPSGGTPGYTYYWTPSNQTTFTATGLAAGTHTVSVMDANACQIDRNVTLIAQAPTVQSVAVPAGGTYGAGQVLVFTVNYDAPIIVSGTPRIQLTIGSNIRYATYAGGTGTAALSFAYTVQAGDADMDGIAVMGLGLNGGTLSSGAASADTTLNSLGSTTGVLVGTPPTVTDARITLSGGTGTGDAYKRGDTVSATWNNSASGDNNSGITGVTVDFSAFGGGAAVAASNTSGLWTASHPLPDGIDGANRNVSVTATGAGGTTTTADTSNATVDTVAPTVTVIAPGG
ncbi:IPT/TIG domain-containing protein [Acidovorax sp. MR-S7]|uniref:IPT/TIG domain-containing protein n=1 Tax=Acidovorax sp. MR-S7 TaxID=1268622 RepID=UPI0003D3F97B|nr:IPT/TIG domain-containing protein [Acidovorax sp. MR-S7]GAD22914.1 hypothetical protein AVS7_02674 [Acidovorax sp. MR-S7]